MELYDACVPWNAVTGAMDLVKQLVPGLGQVGDLTPVFSSWLSENARSESQIWRQPAFMFLHSDPVPELHAIGKQRQNRPVY